MSAPRASICYLDGRYQPLEEARVPVLDRGFLFGDGVYEVIPVYGGRPLALDRHVARLERSLAEIRIPPPHDAETWTAILTGLIERNGGGDQSVYVQVTRGVAPRRDHRFPDPVRPTVLAMSSPLGPPDPAIASEGVAAITAPDPRWARCDIKAITLLPSCLLRQQAADAGAQEAILIRDGLATEGATSNLFVVRRGRVHTPPLGADLLPGVTRALVLEQVAAAGIPLAEAPVPADALGDADEIWLSSSTRQVVPVTRLDGRPVGDGRPGPLWQEVAHRYARHVDALRRGETP